MRSVNLINFTELNENETLMVLAWRNDERVAKFMKNKSVSLDEHLNFIASLKKRSDKRYFLIKDDEIYIGVIDFVNIKRDSCEFGLYANPELKGQGKTLMHAILAYAFLILNAKEISAYVFNENEKAASLYLNFGFEIVKNDGKFSFLRLKNKGEIMQIVMKNYKFLTDDENRQILAIRNLEHIRNMSLNDKIINFDEHKKWLDTANRGGGSAYLAVFNEGAICGGINLVCKDGEYSWGLFFKPQTNAYLVSACTFSFLNFAFAKTDTLDALVRNNNESALKFDKNFGFTEFKKDENFTFLRQSSRQWQEHKSTKLMQKIAKISQTFDIKISA